MQDAKPMELMKRNDTENEIKNIKYYLENEWRYVPKRNDFESKTNNTPFYIQEIDLEEYKSDMLKEESNKCKLSFNISDIEYIIVENSTDIPDLIKFIKKSSRFSDNNDVNLLLTKIMTQSQISNDF